jgi:hypothetical protein
VSDELSKANPAVPIPDDEGFETSHVAILLAPPPLILGPLLASVLLEHPSEVLSGEEAILVQIVFLEKLAQAPLLLKMLEMPQSPFIV